MARRSLVEAHRVGQVRIKNSLIRAVARVWKLLDPKRIDQTTPEWLDVMGRIVRDSRQQSANLSAGYYQAVRQDAIGERVDPAVLKIAGKITDLHLAKSLTFTGPGSLEVYLRKGISEQKASEKALVQAAGDAGRLALNGGRETISETAEADKKVLAYARVTDGDPCAFCAMLASRGPVYRDEWSALYRIDARGDVDKYHPGCACTLVPIYSKSEAWPGRAKEFEELWKEATKGLSNNDARNAFRRAYERKVRASQEEAD